VIEIRHTQDTQSAYDEIYTGEAIHQMDSFFIWICSILGVGAGTCLLDVATGRGQMVEFAAQRGANAYGIDLSQVACTIASKKVKMSFLCANGQELPFRSGVFDIITNLGSLEHFESMDTGVQEMARVLKPSGVACLTVPNTFGLRWNVQHAWKWGDVDDDGQPLQRYGTRKQWQLLLEDNGLSIHKVLGYEHERAVPRTSTDLRNYLKHPKRLLSMLTIARILPVNMAGQFVFICKPK
jgi:2-polyprenyl-3-methyl-5-hydroxy-6-metoxy-1,4-benzoquinol methylase